MTRGEGAAAAAARGSPLSSRRWTAIAAGPGVVPSSSRSSTRRSSYARSASAWLPAASWTSISARCADSRKGAAAIAARAACSAGPSSAPPCPAPANASASSARSRSPSHSERRWATHSPEQSGRKVSRSGSSAAAASRAASAKRPASIAASARATAASEASMSTTDVAVEAHPQLAAAAEHAVAERPPQLGEHGAERGVGGRGRALGPQHVDQLGTRARSLAVEDEVGEEEAALPSGEVGLSRTTFDPYRR